MLLKRYMHLMDVLRISSKCFSQTAFVSILMSFEYDFISLLLQRTFLPPYQQLSSNLGKTIIQTCLACYFMVPFPLLFSGDAGTGKSALAAYLALKSEFPFVKVIQASSFIGLNELQKAVALGKIFDDATKSPLSLILLNDIENILGACLFLMTRFCLCWPSLFKQCLAGPHFFVGSAARNGNFMVVVMPEI